jgi:hypothetical protein
VLDRLDGEPAFEGPQAAPMNCYDLRRHLSKGHHIELRGLDFGQLVKIHDLEHEAVQGHYHGDPPEGDETSR